MAITFEAAMATLTTMFPGAQPDVITMILESNGGHMERTVEQLLTMNVQQKEPIPDGIPRQAIPASGSKGDLNQLPDDFLRPPSYFKQQLVSKNQEEEDRLLAQMLQDEMFMNDVRRNPQLYGVDNARRQQQPQRRAPQPIPQQARAAQPEQPAQKPAPKPDSADDNAGAEELEHSDDEKAPAKQPTLRKKWNSLGDAAKAKFSSLWSRLSKSKTGDQNSYLALPSLDDDMGMEMEPTGYGKDAGAIILEEDDSEAVELEDRRFADDK